jgi:diguanylate cyclase (GGDEF)-like protein/hemerythrin-like metal-binding protein
LSDIEIFPWSLHFATGVELIDAQHQELVRILNEICSGVLSTKDYDGAIDRLFLELISYTKRHFEREEAFFDQHDLPPQLVDDHKEKHRFLVAEAHRLKDYYENHPQDNNDLEELLTTLALWLTRHILSEDMWLVMVIDCLDNGMSLDEAKQHANQEMEGASGTFGRIMGSKVQAASANVRALRRETDIRRKLEDQLYEEIEERRLAEKKLEFLAEHDVLTSLPNRRLYDALASAALKVARRNKASNAVLFLDIDGFKGINDTLGHRTGDELLIQISARLSDCVREADVVARVGGDEFAFLLGGDCGHEDAKLVAEKIVKAIARPFLLEERPADLSASVGVALYPEDGVQLDDLLRHADDAMYTAKKGGKNSYRLYSELAEKPA